MRSRHRNDKAPASAACSGWRRCTDPTAPRLVARYGMRLASKFEQRRFEIHVLECDECFRELRLLWRVEALLDAYGDADEAELPDAEHP